MPAKNVEIRAKILATMRDKGAVGRGYIAAQIGEEPHKLPLRQMRDEGSIEQRGERGQAVYVVKEAKPAKDKKAPKSAAKSKPAKTPASK